MPPAGDRSAVSGIALSGVSGRRWISHPPASALSALPSSPVAHALGPARVQIDEGRDRVPPSSLSSLSPVGPIVQYKTTLQEQSHGVCAVVMWPTVEHP